MKSRIFYTDTCKDIELRVQELLNSHEEFLSPSTARSTRAVGDAIEGILGDSFDTCQLSPVVTPPVFGHRVPRPGMAERRLLGK